MPLSTALTQQIIDKQILQHLEEKPVWSILPPSADNESMDENLSLIEPAIPCSTILHLSSYEHCNNDKSTLNVTYFNFTADYKEFGSKCKIYLTFNVSIQYNSTHNPSFNILVKALDTTFDSYNFYSKIKSIALVSNYKYIFTYKVKVLLAVSAYLKQIRKQIKVLICAAIPDQIQTVLTLPISYFAVFKHIFINTVNQLYDIGITEVLHTLVMLYCGKLNWCLGPPLIYDTLDICCKERVKIAGLECIKMINPRIKNIYCVISTSSATNEIICTKLKCVNLLIYNSDSDKIEIIKESIATYTDFVCLQYRQYAESDDEKYNSENNVILAKCLSLDLNPKILKNKFGKLDFMLWIEWKESILFEWKRHRLCDDSLSSLISWYEMKRVRKENKMKIIQRNRIKSVKQQHKDRQNSSKKKLLHKNQHHSHKRHLYNRW